MSNIIQLRQISDCFPLVDGALVVVDCAEGLTEEFCQIFGKAMTQGLQPVLFLNKLDKLLSLQGDNELCYQRLAQIVDACHRSRHPATFLLRFVSSKLIVGPKGLRLGSWRCFLFRCTQSILGFGNWFKHVWKIYPLLLD